MRRRIAHLRFPTFACSFLILLVSVFGTEPGPIAAHSLATLERQAGGRLGVALLDHTGDPLVVYRADERFPLCSTSKILAISALLKVAESEPNLLRHEVRIQRADLVNYNPITARHVGGTLTYADLCAAAMQYSDNAAMNLILKRLDGPAAVTRFARTIGDNTFRLDRQEPELNTAIPGDVRDTSTPRAMAGSLRHLALGRALAPAERAQLVDWMKGNTTGNASIRAGAPVGWEVADKTGMGGYGTINDVAVLWPPHSPPLVLAVYFTQSSPNARPRPEVIAAATRIVIQQIEVTAAAGTAK